VTGRITIVSTGNIWVADSVYVDGTHDAAGRPTSDNPNVMGLLALGAISDFAASMCRRRPVGMIIGPIVRTGTC